MPLCRASLLPYLDIPGEIGVDIYIDIYIDIQFAIKIQVETSARNGRMVPQVSNSKAPSSRASGEELEEG
ncbi:hypothetical protein [Candidatus Methanocrinis natronophilus]|uniref:Uncharacterized protein n=1 Tax=Candidatus Methanocrinis natronophilus TaxID=3033396 RepID=A0ABT5X875_9EURY|nr:hypothetical protein [Candidatus Methanocrinis natronophilus]MDF0590863.1 hypothetical protein [Candidatus Methanocrinis natronophilus]